MIVFGGACRSGKHDGSAAKKVRKTGGVRDGHVVYSHEVSSFDFVTKTWKLIRSGHSYPNARYDATLAVSSEYGTANLLGPSEPPAAVLSNVGLSPVVERDGGRYAVLLGGFNSMYVNSEPWALSMEWEVAGCGRVDPAEYELRNDTLESMVGGLSWLKSKSLGVDGEFARGPMMLASASTPTLGAGVSAASLAPSNASTTVRFGAGTKFDELEAAEAEKERRATSNPESKTKSRRKRKGRENNGGGGVNPATNNTKDFAEIDPEQRAEIEKALMNLKREKIIAQKLEQEEKAERIKLEDIIDQLKNSIASLEATKQLLQEEVHTMGERNRTVVDNQKIEISNLKELIDEQRHLMLQMDMARIEEMGISRHAKGVVEDNKRNFGNDTVEEVSRETATDGYIHYYTNPLSIGAAQARPASENNRRGLPSGNVRAGCGR